MNHFKILNTNVKNFQSCQVWHVASLTVYGQHVITGELYKFWNESSGAV
jgi:hypothetical protein